MINVVLVDDQILLRECIGYILEDDEEIKVIGYAGNGKEAIELCEKLSPDIVLMDIEMPELDGINATNMIKERFESIKVIMLTTFENPDNIMEAFIAKADGYVVKNISHQDLVVTVKCVQRGLVVIHESVRQIMIDRFKGLSNYKSQYQGILNDKEIEIVRCIASGASNKEIAGEMCYSEGTIKNNISKILEKLEMSDRMQIAIFAIENGIV
jgi:DNA-binding NarL/FixJ family response regulator